MVGLPRHVLVGIPRRYVLAVVVLPRYVLVVLVVVCRCVEAYRFRADTGWRSERVPTCYLLAMVAIHCRRQAYRR